MLVSVVMPSYNHEKYCVEAAQSILDQSHAQIELIVIDDGSKDSSVELLRAINDPRLRLVVQENQGAHAAINRGLELAQGDYLAIINSDDTFDPRRIEKCLHRMDIEQSDFACSWIRVVNGAGEQKGIKQAWKNMRPGWSSSAKEFVYWTGENFALNLLSSNFVSTTSNMLFRRNVYETVGGMRNLRFSHDWDFMLRVATQFPCSVVAEPLMNYRLHGSNTISSNRNWMLFEVLWTVAANLHRYDSPALFGADPAARAAGVRSLYNSLHFNDLDKLFWVVLTFIQSRRIEAGEETETELLDDAELRQTFIDLIPS